MDYRRSNPFWVWLWSRNLSRRRCYSVDFRGWLKWLLPGSMVGYRRVPKPRKRINGSDSQAYAVSDDGSVVVGGSTSGGPSFMWTQATGIQPISNMPVSSTSRALGISGDGKVIVGGSDAAYAYRWRNGVVNYKIGFGEAKAVSDDGNFVVGDYVRVRRLGLDAHSR